MKKESKISTGAQPVATSWESEKLVVFNLLGRSVEIENWKLDRKKVETAAKEFFKREVKAVPAWIAPEVTKNLNGYLGVGWMFLGKRISGETYIGYLVIDGKFNWYPENQMVFGLPLRNEKKTTSFLGVKIFYAEERIQFK